MLEATQCRTMSVRNDLSLNIAQLIGHEICATAVLLLFRLFEPLETKDAKRMVECVLWQYVFYLSLSLGSKR